MKRRVPAAISNGNLSNASFGIINGNVAIAPQGVMSLSGAFDLRVMRDYTLYNTCVLSHPFTNFAVSQPTCCEALRNALNGSELGSKSICFSAVIDQSNKSDSKINFKLPHIYYTRINQLCQGIIYIFYFNLEFF